MKGDEACWVKYSVCFENRCVQVKIARPGNPGRVAGLTPTRSMYLIDVCTEVKSNKKGESSLLPKIHFVAKKAIIFKSPLNLVLIFCQFNSLSLNIYRFLGTRALDIA